MERPIWPSVLMAAIFSIAPLSCKGADTYQLPALVRAQNERDLLKESGKALVLLETRDGWSRYQLLDGKYEISVPADWQASIDFLAGFNFEKSNPNNSNSKLHLNVVPNLKVPSIDDYIQKNCQPNREYVIHEIRMGNKKAILCSFFNYRVGYNPNTTQKIETNILFFPEPNETTSQLRFEVNSADALADFLNIDRIARSFNKINPP